MSTGDICTASTRTSGRREMERTGENRREPERFLRLLPELLVEATVRKAEVLHFSGREKSRTSGREKQHFSEKSERKAEVLLTSAGIYQNFWSADQKFW